MLIADGGTNSLGGKRINQVVATAYGGVHAVMVDTVGEGRVADTAVEELNAYGVDVHSIQTSWDLPTGNTFVTANRKGWPVIFVRRGADALMDPTSFVDELVSADVMLAQGELLPEAAKVIASTASMYNARLVLSLNPVITIAPALTDHADPPIVNVKGAQETTRRLDIAEGIRTIDYRARFEVLLQYYPDVVMFHGDNGCFFVQHPDGLDDDPIICEYPALRPSEKEIADGTGSGDVFAGTLTTELARGTSLYDAVPLVTATGAAAVQVVGACSMLVHHDRLLEMVRAEDLPAIYVYQ